MSILKNLKPYKTLPQRVMIRLSMHPLVHKLLLPFGHDLKPDRWIFVIGCYNSGTTLLASILRKHPEMAGLPNEGAFLTDLLPYPEQKGWPRMWYKCLDHVRVDAGIKDGESKASRIKRQWSFWYPKNARNLVEKTISNAARLPYLNRHFAPAYFIYIIRDGYAVAKGIQRKANLDRWDNPEHYKKYPIDMCAEQWKVTDDIVKNDSPHVERFLTVSYESLTEEPRKTMDKITEFLGLAPIPANVLEEGWDIHEVSSEIKNMNSNSFKYLSEDDVAEIEKVAGEKLLQYGYKRPSIG